MFWLCRSNRCHRVLNLVLDIKVQAKVSRWVAMSWLVMQAMAIIVIVTCMCLVLRHRWTGFQKTDSVICRMILYTISTGLVTSVLSCILLSMFPKYGLNPLGGFYSVTMLSNPRMRKTLRARLDTPSLFEMIGSSMKMRIPRKVGDRGDEERFRATRINIFK
ncbi:hypothetical protein BS47DRAFT_103456 [Hydnum rufescens UP504]|uniref:DUF6534 domain-containing protein n=1 Tax=Hydnum rufescens UP504 TaxID=1448309 RepID=A0A9P6DT24_9AGAM|nr:hypothetical protein BS47DRAFT_103456 [Hydnum rufescens UP504]